MIDIEDWIWIIVFILAIFIIVIALVQLISLKILYWWIILLFIIGFLLLFITLTLHFMYGKNKKRIIVEMDDFPNDNLTIDDQN